jgi:hypothetical protein
VGGRSRCGGRLGNLGWQGAQAGGAHLHGIVDLCANAQHTVTSQRPLPSCSMSTPRPQAAPPMLHAKHARGKAKAHTPGPMP